MPSYNSSVTVTRNRALGKSYHGSGSYTIISMKEREGEREGGDQGRGKEGREGERFYML